MSRKLKRILFLLIIMLGIFIGFPKILGNDFTRDSNNGNLEVVGKTDENKIGVDPKEVDEEPLVNSMEVYKYTTAKLNIRTGPGTDYEIIETIAKNEKVEVVGHEEKWDEIIYNDIKGYSLAEYLSEIEPEEDISLVVSNETMKIIKGILLVNKTYALPMGYDPGVDNEAKSQLDKMFKAAKDEIDKTLSAYSGYRTYEYQKGLFERYAKKEGYEKASMYSAKPRHSEHESGLAYDIGGADQNYWLKKSFEDTVEGIWLRENAYRFGYILRYPDGKTDITGYIYEPWHFRYIGIEHATEVYEKDLTLEEYLLEDN